MSYARKLLGSCKEYRIRSATQPTMVARVQNPDLLDQVDYRLAETPQEKEEIYSLRYRAYLREGAIEPSVTQRVTDRYEDLPNAWTFGVYLNGELYSSVRISVLTQEWRESCSAGRRTASSPSDR